MPLLRGFEEVSLLPLARRELGATAMIYGSGQATSSSAAAAVLSLSAASVGSEGATAAVQALQFKVWPVFSARAGANAGFTCHLRLCMNVVPSPGVQASAKYFDCSQSYQIICTG